MNHYFLKKENAIKPPDEDSLKKIAEFLGINPNDVICHDGLTNKYNPYGLIRFTDGVIMYAWYRVYKRATEWNELARELKMIERHDKPIIDPNTEIESRFYFTVNYKRLKELQDEVSRRHLTVINNAQQIGYFNKVGLFISENL